MDCFRKIALLLVSMVALQNAAHAQTDTCYMEGAGKLGVSSGESIVSRFALYYRNDRTDVDEGYMKNTENLAEIRRYLQSSPHIDSITIYAYASPEGVYEHNVWLSKRRAAVARDYILRYLSPSSGLAPDKIILHPMEENWDGLYEAVVQGYHRADREKVLSILKADVRNDTKKWRLQQLSKGDTYKYIIRHIMPHLRLATWICVWTKPAPPKPPVPDDKLEPVETAGFAVATVVAPIVPPALSIPAQARTKRTILALKTNMLYDAVTALNFSVEGVINRNFSILYEHHCPWWLTDSNRYCLQFLSFGGEFRWWFRPTTARYASRTDWVQRDALVGHFLGLYGFGGKLDLQAKRKGCYQAEFLSFGLTYGYSMPIAKRLNLEFSISVGYADIPYRHYIPTDDYDLLIRDRNKQGRTHYVGPTKVEIALVLPILATFKTKGGKR